MHSMTGYGMGQAALGDAALLIEARSVNHRYLDVRVRLPIEIADRAHLVDAVARRRLVRGHVELTGRLEGGLGAGPRLDTDRARAAYAALRALRDELAPDEPLPLSLLAAVPDLFSTNLRFDPEVLRQALEEASQRACDALWEMRAREGRALHDELERLLSAAQAETRAIAAHIPEMVQVYRERLRTRLTTLLQAGQVSVDPGRIEHEIALFADRTDVAEELARLQSHFGQLQRLLDAAEGSIGRKLDFLLQEMAREANTIGSKVSDANLTLHVVELKAVLERIREQVQNVL